MEVKFRGVWDRFAVFWGIDAEMELDEVLNYDLVINPLSKKTTVQQIKEYDWPDGTDIKPMVGLRERANKLRKSTPYSIVTSPYLGNLFEYTT